MPKTERHDWTPLRIKELRVRLGLNQAEFAALLTKLRGGKYLHRAQVSHWEGGFNRPSLSWKPIFDQLDASAAPLATPTFDYRRILGGGKD